MVAPLIELRRAAIGYDDRPAVAEVDLMLRRGEIVALVGPNGAGKTTLVRGVRGLASVLSGEVLLFGEPVARFGARFRIGYLPQRHTVGGAIPSTAQEVVASGWLARNPHRPGSPARPSPARPYPGTAPRHRTPAPARHRPKRIT